MRAELEEWTVRAKASNKPETTVVGDGEAILVKYVKDMCAEAAAIFSAPRHLFVGALPVDPNEQLHGGELAMPVAALDQKSATVIGVGARVSDLLRGCAGGLADIAPELLADMMFFKVL